MRNRSEILTPEPRQLLLSSKYHIYIIPHPISNLLAPGKTVHLNVVSLKSLGSEITRIWQVLGNMTVTRYGYVVEYLEDMLRQRLKRSGQFLHPLSCFFV